VHSVTCVTLHVSKLDTFSSHSCKLRNRQYTTETKLTQSIRNPKPKNAVHTVFLGFGLRISLADLPLSGTNSYSSTLTDPRCEEFLSNKVKFLRTERIIKLQLICE